MIIWTLIVVMVVLSQLHSGRIRTPNCGCTPQIMCIFVDIDKCDGFQISSVKMILKIEHHRIIFELDVTLLTWKGISLSIAVI